MFDPFAINILIYISDTTSNFLHNSVQWCSIWFGFFSENCGVPKCTVQTVVFIANRSVLLCALGFGLPTDT